MRWNYLALIRLDMIQCDWILYNRLGDNDGSRHCFTESTDELDEVTFWILSSDFFFIHKIKSCHWKRSNRWKRNTRYQDQTARHPVAFESRFYADNLARNIFFFCVWIQILFYDDTLSDTKARNITLSLILEFLLGKVNCSPHMWQSADDSLDKEPVSTSLTRDEGLATKLLYNWPIFTKRRSLNNNRSTLVQWIMLLSWLEIQLLICW